MPSPYSKQHVAKAARERIAQVKRRGAKLVELADTLRHLTQRLDDVVHNDAAFQYTWARSAALMDFSEPCADDPMSSRVCRQADCGAEYAEWMRQLRESPKISRKDWEWSAICRALDTAGLLTPGKRALGFAVGTEPLVAAFAARGIEVVATDLAADDARAQEWAATNQHALNFEGLRKPEICSDDVLAERTTIRAVDMNHIPDDLKGFDFIWSSCAFEHLGSIEAGLTFVERSMDCLVPGGISVHTTEFNLDSNDDTEDEGGTVAFRSRDFAEMEHRLAAKGHTMTPLLEGSREGIFDYLIDVPPKHFGALIVRLGDYRITPAVIVVRAGGGSS
jgi:Methyltransferase domain